MSALSDLSPADEHAYVAARFLDIAQAAPSDRWNAPSPVEDWTAREVVGHLVDWFAGFLSAGAGIELPPVTSVDDDPVAAWKERLADIQALLDEPGDRVVNNPHIGEIPLAQGIDQFYTADVFMHTWDLARALGQDDRLDEARCRALFEGMEPLDEMLRQSGQYGARVPVPDGANWQTKMLGFIGRDPQWRP